MKNLIKITTLVLTFALLMGCGNKAVVTDTVSRAGETVTVSPDLTGEADRGKLKLLPDTPVTAKKTIKTTDTKKSVPQTAPKTEQETTAAPVEETTAAPETAVQESNDNWSYSETSNSDSYVQEPQTYVQEEVTAPAQQPQQPVDNSQSSNTVSNPPSTNNDTSNNNSSGGYEYSSAWTHEHTYHITDYNMNAFSNWYIVHSCDCGDSYIEDLGWHDCDHMYHEGNSHTAAEVFETTGRVVCNACHQTFESKDAYNAHLVAEMATELPILEEDINWRNEFGRIHDGTFTWEQRGYCPICGTTIRWLPEWGIR